MIDVERDRRGLQHGILCAVDGNAGDGVESCDQLRRQGSFMPADILHPFFLQPLQGSRQTGQASGVRGAALQPVGQELRLQLFF